MEEGMGKKFLKKYGKDLEARERGNVANNAGEEFDGDETTTSITPEDVACYTLPESAPPTPEELETKRNHESGKEWIKKMRESLKEKGAYEKPVDYAEKPKSK